tara:strand:+ start:733 stop:957 length:225 start_codon:yes stop_codon:yes gene_type:complete
MTLTNPSIPLYNNIDRHLKKAPVKVKSKGLLNRNNNMNRNNNKQSELTKPLTTVVNHFMAIRQAREEINNDKQV